jgi:catechol 2,3-dioxygenase-like lactoylglutathione lyase family enzyme
MKPRITVITLGVNDLEKALSFYRDDGHLWEIVWNPQFEND